jgi:hypothetical protein
LNGPKWQRNCAENGREWQQLGRFSSELVGIVGRMTVWMLTAFVRRGMVDDSLRIWRVQFEPGGRVFTYCRTRSALEAEMRDRLAIGKGKPHRVETAIDRKNIEVRLDLD